MHSQGDIFTKGSSPVPHEPVSTGEKKRCHFGPKIYLCIIEANCEKNFKPDLSFLLKKKTLIPPLEHLFMYHRGHL